MRKGRKYEAGGTLLIVAGIPVCAASGGTGTAMAVGALLIVIGFGAFIAGRFMEE
jgi:hypothetical protein